MASNYQTILQYCNPPGSGRPGSTWSFRSREAPGSGTPYIHAWLRITSYEYGVDPGRGVESLILLASRRPVSSPPGAPLGRLRERCDRSAPGDATSRVCILTCILLDLPAAVAHPLPVTPCPFMVQYNTWNSIAPKAWSEIARLTDPSPLSCIAEHHPAFFCEDLNICSMP